PTLLPPGISQIADRPGLVTTSSDIDAVLPKTDVLYLLRVQRERMQAQVFPSSREFARLWGIDRDRLHKLPDDALVMHPGPMNRGVEVTADVADAPNAVITDQVTNGIAVRMSCLYLLLGGEADRREGEQA